ATGDVEIYRAVLVPHFARARLRRRCRTFLDRTFRDVVGFALRNGASSPADQAPGGLAELSDVPQAVETVPALGDYREPRASFRWDLRGAEVERRVHDPKKYAYIVQYNESDLDFVSRLLEAEGLSYFFEHAADSVVLWITD